MEGRDMLNSIFLNRDSEWSQLDRMQHTMNRLFEQFSGNPRRSFPQVNLYANTDSAIIIVELPGFNPQNVQLSIDGDELVMKGIRPRQELGSNEHCHRQERPQGNFERLVRLPFAVDADKAQAKFKNGVLTISLSRAETDKPKKIQIKTN
jgi:HSP20 family protein